MNLKPARLNTLTPSAKKGRSDSQENVDNNMSQVISSLAVRSIRSVKNNTVLRTVNIRPSTGLYVLWKIKNIY